MWPNSSEPVLSCPGIHFGTGPVPTIDINGRSGARNSPPARSRLDLAHLKRRRAADEHRPRHAPEDALRFAAPPPTEFFDHGRHGFHGWGAEPLLHQCHPRHPWLNLSQSGVISQSTFAPSRRGSPSLPQQRFLQPAEVEDGLERSGSRAQGRSSQCLRAPSTCWTSADSRMPRRLCNFSSGMLPMPCASKAPGSNPAARCGTSKRVWPGWMVHGM